MSMRILIVNDDGIHAEGLLHLARAASKFGRVWIVAPSGQCSAMAHRVTIRKPMELESVEYSVPVEGAWSLAGMPADCVKIALNYLLEEKPDLILSGINHGINAGYDTFYSGTVSAAIEGAMHGIPSIALSNEDGENWEITDAMLEQVLEELIQNPAPAGSIWNVNFPADKLDAYNGILRDVTIHHGYVYSEEITEGRSDAGVLTASQDGESMFHIPGEEGSDLRAVQERHVAIGRIHWER